MEATWTKMRDGAWGVRVPGAPPAAGASVAVVRKDGTVSTVTVDRVVWSGDRVAICRVRSERRTAPAGRAARSDRSCHTDGNCSSVCDPRTCPCGDGSWFRCC